MHFQIKCKCMCGVSEPRKNNKEKYLAVQHLRSQQERAASSRIYDKQGPSLFVCSVYIYLLFSEHKTNVIINCSDASDSRIRRKQHHIRINISMHILLMSFCIDFPSCQRGNYRSRAAYDILTAATGVRFSDNFLMCTHLSHTQLR